MVDITPTDPLARVSSLSSLNLSLSDLVVLQQIQEVRLIQTAVSMGDLKSQCTRLFKEENGRVKFNSK